MLNDSNIFSQSYDEKTLKEYTIKINTNFDYMNITIKKKNIIYESDLNIDYFKQYKKLYPFNTISEIAKFIYKCIDKNSILIEDNDKNLKFNITEVPNCEIILSQKNSKNILDQLMNEIRNLKQENQNIIQSQKTIYEKLKEIEKENKELKQLNKNNEDTIKELANKINNIGQKLITPIKNCNLKLINSIQPHKKIINSVSIFPSGKIISTSEDMSIKIYDTYLNIIQEIKEAHDDVINYIEIKDENNFMTCSKDNNIKLWIKKKNLFVQNCRIFKAHEGQIIKVIYLPNGNIISCSYDTTIKIWEEKNNNNKENSIYERKITLNHLKKIASILYLEDKKILISSGEDGTKFWNLNDINNINFENIKLIKEYEDTFCGWNNALCKIDNNKIIIGGNENGIMSVISIQDNQIKKIFNNFCVWGICFIKNKNVFLVSGKSNNINIYGCDNYNCLQCVENAHYNSINGLIETKDESILSYSNDKWIKEWCF